MANPIAEAVEKLLTALNTGRGDDARALVHPACWEAGKPSPAAMAADETLLVQAFPGILETDTRAAARVTGFYKGGQRSTWWFLFAQVDDGWRLERVSPTRIDAEQFLKGAPLPAPAAAPEPAPAPAGPSIPEKLREVLERLTRALKEGDLDAARALTAPDAWRASDHSPERLAQSAARAGVETIALAEVRVRGDRAAALLGFIGGGGGSDGWVVLRRDPAFGWQWVAAPSQWAPAGLFVTGLTDAVPAWSDLPADASAARWGKSVVEALREGVGPVEGIPDDAWASLADGVAEGHDVALGEVRSLPPVHRAAVEIGTIDPEYPDDLDSRYAILERADATSPWSFRELAYARGISALLEGVEIPWGADAPGPDEEQGLGGGEEALREEVKKKVLEMLHAQGISAETAEDLSKLPKEQLEQMIPQLVGGAFAAVFGTLLGKLKAGLDEADARDPEVTVDLQHERARREGKAKAPSRVDDDVSREMRAALRDALGSASKEGEVRVDGDFLQNEAPKLIGSLFGAVAKALAPTEVTLDVGSEAGSDEGPTKVTLPIGELFGKLFSDAAVATDASNREEE